MPSQYLLRKLHGNGNIEVQDAYLKKEGTSENLPTIPFQRGIPLK